MAAKKKQTESVSVSDESTVNSDDKLVKDLITDLNKQYQGRIAYNLATDESPTHVARWISTGSEVLDYACSNLKGGGLPEGRIVEIAGQSGIGKSHLAAQICKSVQKMGGLAIYLDTENATDPMNLKNLGVDIAKRFVYIEPACVEDVFDIVERTVEKVKASNKTMPIVVVWDSLAATPPKAELEGDYDKETIGLQARALGRGFRKITQVIANQNVLFVVNNQLRVKIGVIGGDPTVTPGGNALPFYASVRIRLQGGKHLRLDANDKTSEPYGIEVEAKLIKNRMTTPHRRANFQIHFGKGVFDHEEIFDLCREWCDANKKTPFMLEGKTVSIEGTGGNKYLIVSDPATGEVAVEKAFFKKKFGEVRKDPQYKKWIDPLVETVLTRKIVPIAPDEEDLEEIEKQEIVNED